MSHKCAVCGATMYPFNNDGRMVAHELDCYIRHPDKVPPHHEAEFHKLLAWRVRSGIAKEAAKKRKR